MTLVEIFLSLPSELFAELERQLDAMPVQARFIEAEGIKGHYVSDVEDAAWAVVAEMKMFASSRGISDVKVFQALECLPNAICDEIFGPRW
jgi:hypothetical protein